MAEGRRAEYRGKEVIAHGEALRIVPEGGNGIAVVIRHNDSISQSIGIARRRGRSEGVDELIYGAAIVGLLFIAIIVVLVANGGLRARQPRRLSGVGVMGQQRLGQPVNRRSIWRRGERRFAGSRVGGVRIRREIVIKRNIFLKDYDDVLDRSRRGRALGPGASREQSRGSAEEQTGGFGVHRIRAPYRTRIAASRLSAAYDG